MIFQRIASANSDRIRCNMLTPNDFPTGDSFVLQQRLTSSIVDWYDNYQYKRTFFGDPIYVSNDEFMHEKYIELGDQALKGYKFTNIEQGNVIYVMRFIYPESIELNSRVTGYWILTAKNNGPSPEESEQVVSERNLSCLKLLRSDDLLRVIKIF